MTRRREQLRHRLIDCCRKWASGKAFDASEAGELRGELIRLNHNHYLENIPVYRTLAAEEGIGRDCGIQEIKEKLMLDAGVFKSYEQSWLDGNNYAAMDQWLSGIHDTPVSSVPGKPNNIDDWIEHVQTRGTHVVYSSGTSGAFSFVPRRTGDWEAAREANFACLAPQLMQRMSEGFSGRLVKTVLQNLSGKAMLDLVQGRGIPGYDAAFLGFRNGRMGNQALISELAPLFRHHYFLYDFEITGTALRQLRQGSPVPGELRSRILERNEDSYRDLIEKLRQSTRNGQKVMLFGAPFQFKELCGTAMRNGLETALHDGSVAIFGGGWKTFAGESVSREELAGSVSSTLHIPHGMIMEGYSMTEINMLMLRCEHGRFHVPPVIEPVIYDDALRPVEGEDLRGAFGFLDTLAFSYPGFIITSDYVHMVDSECECGLSGPALLDVSRLPGSEVKGCGGIMSSLQA